MTTTTNRDTFCGRQCDASCCKRRGQAAQWELGEARAARDNHYACKLQAHRNEQ